MTKFTVTPLSSGRHAQGGATLIEILVSVLILSIGMIGMVSLQAKSMQFHQSSLYRSQANTMVYNIIDLMRANRSDNTALAIYRHGINDAVFSTFKSCITSTCTPQELARFDLFTWLNDIAAVLPSGLGEITVDNSGLNPLYIITIQYDDIRADRSSAFSQDQSKSLKQITFRTEL